MHTPEWFEKRDIKKYLDERKCWYFSPQMAGYGKAGVPDIIACIDGKMVAIEVKRAGKPLTPMQARMLEEIAAAGGVCFWGIAKTVIACLKDL
jgi:Holliday junction resolvase